MVRAELERGAYKGNADAERLDATLAFVQQELFDLGTELATPPSAAYPGMIRVTEENVTRLETFIDELQPDLEPLQSFVLPGGGPAGATLHLARTVCRRAERTVTALVRRRCGRTVDRALSQPVERPVVRAVAMDRGRRAATWKRCGARASSLRRTRRR